MAAKSKARARAATRKQSKPGKTKAKTSEEIGGMLFVGSIIVFGVIGMMFWNTGLGWVLGVGVGFILMALAWAKG